jgi:branched-subunit amino acid ABC-type transport system permease component
MIAMSSEIQQRPVRREIWKQPVVLFRTRQGEMRALEDRCAHRLVRLSRGRVKDDKIECAYHGWQFNGATRIQALDTTLQTAIYDRAIGISPAQVKNQITIVAVVVAAAALGLLALLLMRTTIGLHMRAAATDFGTARLLGVRANRVIGFAVLLSGILAAIVAVILTVQFPFVGPDFALRDTIVVLVGVVVGGIDRLWTATLGGFAIGFTTGVIYGALPTEQTVFLPSVVFALVILVLLIRPAGLFAWGRGPVERV